MNTTKPKLAFSTAVRLAVSLTSLAACILVTTNAHAHLTYSGRDFGSYSGLTNGTTTITNQTVTGNYGWADAADGVLGDSHRGRAFRFHLNSAAFVTFTVSANSNATPTALGGFTPAFSVYAGLATVAPFPPSQTTNAASADHDFSASSVAWRIWWVKQNLDPEATDESATDGSWNALGDWKIGGDGDLPGDFSQLTSLTYKGSAKSFNANGTVTGNFALPAGDYTILVGGNDIANKTSDTALAGFGISTTLSVSPTPSVSLAQKIFVGVPTGLTTNWVLQSAASPDATNWSKVTQTPVTVNGQAGVLLDRDAGQLYFRLNYVP